MQLQETAQAIWEDDLHNGFQRRDRVVSKLAKAKPKNAVPWQTCLSILFVFLQVRDSLQAFDDVGLVAKVTMSYDRIADDAFYPWIRPSDYLKALHRRGRLDLVLPEATLEASRATLSEYWKRFRCIYPAHEVFTVLTEQQLAQAVPCCIHGDEGRSSQATNHCRHTHFTRPGFRWLR